MKREKRKTKRERQVEEQENAVAASMEQALLPKKPKMVYLDLETYGLTSTGRVSSSTPNLSNPLRSAATPGMVKVFEHTDFGSLEQRMLQLCKDKVAESTAELLGKSGGK